MRHKLYPLVLLSAAALAGCTVPDQTMTLNGASPLPKGKVVTVYLSDFAPIVGYPLVHWWDVSIVSVDGKPVGPKDGTVQLGVGAHRFTYRCLARIAYHQIFENTGQGTVTYHFTQQNLGRQYFPVAKDYVGFVETGTRRGTVADGNCGLSRLTTANPEIAQELGHSY